MTAKAKGTIKLKWFRSAIQAPVKHKKVIKGLGFTRLEPGHRARGLALHSWNGGEGSAPGGIRRQQVNVW